MISNNKSKQKIFRSEMFHSNGNEIDLEQINNNINEKLKNQ